MNTYRIPEMVKPYLEYDMIQNHTDLPHFPEYRTRLLYTVLNKQSALKGFSDLYSLVTSLVQIALDTHDTISVTNDDKEKKASRARQLKVLAGCYFSSRFYHMLSQAGQINLISILSDAICEANRIKMNIYTMMKQLKMTADEYMKQTVEAKSQLFLAFSSLFDEKIRPLWPEILRLLTRCEVLIAEILRADAAKQLRDSWGYWHIMQTGTKEDRQLLYEEETEGSKLHVLWQKYNITPQLYAMLQMNMKELQDKLALLASDIPDAELQAIREPFHQFLSSPRAFEQSAR